MPSTQRTAGRMKDSRIHWTHHSFNPGALQLSFFDTNPVKMRG